MTHPNHKDLSLEEIVNNTYEASEEYATAASLYHRYREGEKNKIAKIKHEIRKSQTPPDGKKGWTKDDLEEYALASEEWEKFLDEYTKTYEAMLRAKNNMEAFQSLFEAKRSVMASERALTKMG